MLAFILGVWVYATQLVAGLVVVRALAYEGSASGRVARALLLGPAAITVQCLLYDLLSLPFTLLLVLLPWWIAAAVVVATPMVWEFGENGFADLRLTATLLLLLLEAVHWLDRRDTTSALRFSAVAAAAALTKNEGLMIASIAVLFMVGLVARRVVTWSATRAAIAILLLVVLA